MSVDVGTGSVRACFTSFDENSCGSVVSTHSQQTVTHSPQSDFYEQCSREVWDCVVSCIRQCLTEAKTDRVNGIAFTATCSLVAIDSGLKNDIILWLDHRALKEADMITETNLPQLNQSGGVCSPEFSVSKLVWLKRNAREVYERAVGFLELPDFLTWKCLGMKDVSNFYPSNCSVTCKWFYDAENKRWDQNFAKNIELDDLFLSNNERSRVGKVPSSHPGSCQGFMSKQVKQDMGISVDCNVSVGSSIIDAHAGVLGMIALYPRPASMSVESLFCSIAGTSTCHMILNEERRTTHGVWGPYLDVVTKGHFVREPGQSATGKLIDSIIQRYSKDHENFSNKSVKEITIELNQMLQNRGLGNKKQKLIINPSFHGNRCPLADPSLRGGIYGLDLEKEPLEDIYEATIESLCYETRFICEELKIPDLKVALVSGGLLKNTCFMQIYADIMGIKVVGMDSGHIDMMLAGTAILARQASVGKDNTLHDMRGITFRDLKLTNFEPNPSTKSYHDAKYKCYHIFMKSSQEMQKILNTL